MKMLDSKKLTIEVFRFARFSLVGILAGLVYVIVTFSLASSGIAGPLAATVTGHFAAMAISYFGHLHYSFAVDPDHRTFLWHFLVTAAVGFAANIGITSLL